MRSLIRLTSVVALVNAVVPIAASGQHLLPPVGEPAEVMILGTYHFDNPGLDVVKTEVADILSPGRQAEVEEVVEALSSYRPTRVAVEVLVSAQDRVGSLYGAFRAGRHELTRNEVQQLGFRLAARFDRERVHAVDREGVFPFGAVMDYAQEHGPGFVTWINDRLAAIQTELNRQQRESSVAEILRQMNDAEALAADHGP